MNEKKHTTGPWSWERSPLDGNRIALSNDLGQDVMTTISEDSQGHTFINISDENACVIEAAGDLLAALDALFSNPYVDLGDLVYQVREREGKGWDGEAVKAWSDAVMAGKALIEKAKPKGEPDDAL